MKHTIVTHSYMPAQPPFDTLTEARLTLKNWVAQSLKQCKTRMGSAFKHKLSEDSYSITLGQDPRSALWTTHTIVSA